jgi:hypothetical protein
MKRENVDERDLQLAGGLKSLLRREDRLRLLFELTPVNSPGAAKSKYGVVLFQNFPSIFGSSAYRQVNQG